VRSEKIVRIGAAASGKTCLVNRFAYDRFTQHSEATIGAAFIAKTVIVGDTAVRLEIWDTGGTEKYKALAPMYYRDARAAVVVFDVTSEESFREARKWLTEFRERGQPTALVVCAANKIDLADRRRVTEADAKEFEEENQVEFLTETSALSGTRVNDLFAELTRRLLALPEVSGGGVPVNKDPPPQMGGNCC
jgi:Ras-related protein Rab-5C